MARWNGHRRHVRYVPPPPEPKYQIMEGPMPEGRLLGMKQVASGRYLEKHGVNAFEIYESSTGAHYVGIPTIFEGWQSYPCLFEPAASSTREGSL